MIVFDWFIKYKAHIGFSIRNTLLLTTWFLYKLRKTIWIINIFKTILFIKIIFRFIRFLVNNNFPLWFVNLEVTKEFLFKNFAHYCGEFYCTKLWIRGFLSNFKSVQDSLNRFILKKYITKVTAKAFYAEHWAFTRYTWPRGIFISNIKSNYIIAKEAGSLNLPMIAIVDTNVKNFLFNLPIPGNSESNDSLCFIVNLISKQILLMKYKKLLNWYTLIKLQKGKNINNYTKLYEGLKQNAFSALLKKKKGSFITLNSFRKLKESMHLLKTPIKIDNSLIIVKTVKNLISKYKFIKKIFVFSYFFKTAVFKLRLKASKEYKKNIKNFIKFSKMSAWYFFKKKKKYIQRIFRNFMPLNLSYILYNFKLSKIFYETYRRRTLVDAAIVIPIKHWKNYKQRINRIRYTKKPMTNFWLVPFFKKFFIKINKWQFFHSKYYSEETYIFNNYIRWYKYYITKFTKVFYNRWFFYFLNQSQNYSV